MFLMSFVPDHFISSKLLRKNRDVWRKAAVILALSTTFLAPGTLSAQQIRIMPLGDSITHGEHGSTPIGGFRDDLADMLLDEGIDFDLVGTLHDGTEGYPRHEGHPGETARYLAANINYWLNQTYPDIVLLHIGTNDINSRYSNTTIRNDIETLIENIWDYDPNIPVLLCSLIPRDDSYNSINTDLCRLIHQLTLEKQTEGKAIRYVGQNEIWITNYSWANDYLYDAFHPNNSGYYVMADVYFSILMNQITGTSQFITDNFNRARLNMIWEKFDPYVISSDKLTTASGGNYWWKPAVYAAEMDPIAVAFRWGSNVNPALDGNAGLALHIQDHSPNSNGYLVYKESATGNLKLHFLSNGVVGALIDEAPGLQSTPATGDRFAVSTYSDDQGLHFTCFTGENYDGDLIDPTNSYGEGDEQFAGVMLAGTANNIVDDFQLIHVAGSAARIHAMSGDEQQGDPETQLADSLVVLVTDDNGIPISGIPVSFQVTQGDAIIEEPEAANHFEFEAEYGEVTYPMQILNDANASNGQYVEVPQEYADDSAAKVVFQFTVAEAGNFVVWGRVKSAGDTHDSFKVIMDQQSEIVWHISGKTNWTWDEVYIYAGEDPKIFYLSPGTHTLTIKNREWASKLDKVVITSDLDYNPNQLKKTTLTYHVTDASGRAHAFVMLGETPGEVKINASSPDFSDYTVFSATVLTEQIPTSLTIIEGNNQVGLPGATLPVPLTVEVRDAANSPVTNLSVNFEITQGVGASLSAAQPMRTNAQGRASTSLTLGSAYGTYAVRASCPGYSVAPVTFQATATSAVLTISGDCIYYEDNLAIPDVTVKTSGSSVVTATTNSQGFYQLQGLTINGNYTASPQRTPFTDWNSHLITTYQAALTLRQAVGLEQFSANRIKAADVDLGGTVTAFDAALIAQFAVGITDHADSHVGEWAFIPGFRSYFGLNANIENQDYIGILLGDVTGDWNDTYGTKKTNSGQPLVCFDPPTLNPDLTVTIPIQIGQPQDVLSWQIHIVCDPATTEFVDLRAASADENWLKNENRTANDIHYGMYRSEPVRCDDALALLTLRLKNPATHRITLEIPYFQINNQPAQQGMAAIDLDSHLPDSFVLLQNYPNPFNPATTILYQLPATGYVEMEIFNLSGQKVATLIAGEKQAGAHQIFWDGKDQSGASLPSGLYFCNLHYGKEVKTIRLLKVK
ncbi:MAG: GDSL-type esterase/lipase family protein [Candidatus Zhuqueibacterota bacterium]